MVEWQIFYILKRLVFILFLFPTLLTAQSVWHVKPDGDDSKDGTSIANAWKSWGKAFNETGSISAGDTVYFHDGIYYKDGTESAGYFRASTNGYQITVDGTAGSPVHYRAYAGATPILDCDTTSRSGTNYGIYASDVSHVNFYGLTVRNVWANVNDNLSEGWTLSGDTVVIENCQVYNTHGTGFKSWASDSLLWLNCDSYYNCDSLDDYLPGNSGTGFHVVTTDSSSRVYIDSCRAWYCGDDGFSSTSPGLVKITNSWFFLNGSLEGAGNGLKLGFLGTDDVSQVTRKVYNNVSVFNRASGLTTNDNNDEAVTCQVYNNLFYHNGYYSGWALDVDGIKIYNTDTTDVEEEKRIFKNNVSYDNETDEIAISANALYTHEYNDWDLGGVTVTAADFLNTDSATIVDLMKGARLSDSTLPDLSAYLGLVSTSDLIDAGTDLGYGDDLGPFQYVAPGSPPTAPTVTSAAVTHISITAIKVGCDVTADGSGTISQRGVCYNTTGTPTTDDSKTSIGTNTGYSELEVTGLTANTTYYLRAYVTNEHSTTYGAEITFTTLKDAGYTSGSKVLTSGSKIIK